MIRHMLDKARVRQVVSDKWSPLISFVRSLHSLAGSSASLAERNGRDGMDLSAAPETGNGLSKTVKRETRYCWPKRVFRNDKTRNAKRSKRTQQPS